VSRDVIEYASAMQQAFVDAAAKAGKGRTFQRVARVANRQRLKREPAWGTHLKYRTAQKLKREGVI